jgi:hypothetical protein
MAGAARLYPPPAHPPASLTEPNLGNYLNNTLPGARLPDRALPPMGGHRDFLDYSYLIDWVSTPRLSVQWRTTPAAVRNGTVVVVIPEALLNDHYLGARNRSCADGAFLALVPACNETIPLAQCNYTGVVNVSTPRSPGVYVVAMFVHDGSPLPGLSSYWEDKLYTRQIAQLAYDPTGADGAQSRANNARVALDSRKARNNATLLCYATWLRPLNVTTRQIAAQGSVGGWFYLGDAWRQRGELTRFYAQPPFYATTQSLTLLEGGSSYEYSVVYDSGAQVPTQLWLQTWSNCHYTVEGEGVGGQGSQTTHIAGQDRALRLLRVQSSPDFGRSDRFVRSRDNLTMTVRVRVDATQNLHHAPVSRVFDVVVVVRHWVICAC